MENIEVGDIVEVHGYDSAPVWNGVRLRVVEVHGGFYEGAVSGELIESTGLGATFEQTARRALFYTENLRKVGSDEATEEPPTEKPVEAEVVVYLHNDDFSPYHYAVEFDSAEEFEEYQKNPFTDMSVEYKVNDYAWSSTKFLRLRYKNGTALIDPGQLKLMSINRTS